MRDGLDQVVVEVGRPAPGSDGAVAERPRLVRDDQVGVNLELAAEPGAGRARTVRVVEGEVSRRQFLHREAVVGAGEVLAEELLVALTFVARDENEAIREFRCGFDRFAHPTNGRGFNWQPVDIYFNVVFLVLLERDLFVELVEIAINPNSTEAGLSGLGKDVL